MNGKRGSPISRREFARRAAIVSAVSIVPANALPMHSSVAELSPKDTTDLSSLSPENQAEAEARYQAILGTYGSHFSNAEKSELLRLCLLAQPPLENLRKYAIENSDGPALYLKPLVEREKKPGSTAIPRTAGQAAKKL